MGANFSKDGSPVAREAWTLMSDLVLANGRRRQVSEALGMSFGRARALRRVARRAISMGELAAALEMDPPNATKLVDDLEAEGLVRRQPHPSDRRTRLVTATRKGTALAKRADQILATPPASLAGLSDADLGELRRLLRKTGA